MSHRRRLRLSSLPWLPRWLPTSTPDGRDGSADFRSVLPPRLEQMNWPDSVSDYQLSDFTVWWADRQLSFPRTPPEQSGQIGHGSGCHTSPSQVRGLLCLFCDPPHICGAALVAVRYEYIPRYLPPTPAVDTLLDLKTDLKHNGTAGQGSVSTHPPYAGHVDRLAKCE